MQNGSYHKALVMSGYMIGSAIVALSIASLPALAGAILSYVKYRARTSDVTAWAYRQRRCSHSHCSGYWRIQPSITAVTACIVPLMSIRP